MLSLFYTRKELATRISILFTGEIISWVSSGIFEAC